MGVMDQIQPTRRAERLDDIVIEANALNHAFESPSGWSTFNRIHPRVAMTHDQAQKWWDYLGVAMIAKSQLTKSFDPNKDLFDLQYQASSMAS
jgi:hypothetical protein